LRLDAVSFAFTAGRPAVDGVSLSLERGQFLALLGPSGCGKTTLLRLVGGYRVPDAGRVLLGGDDVTAWPPERRGVGMVFQSYALFPHLSARANVAFGLEVQGVPRAERHRRVEAMLDRVGLDADERDRRPHQLSGGQQQRVAIARALVIEPRLLLLDEPLANLDRGLREQMRAALRELQRATGVTAVLVTHDQEEALALADTVGVMREGRVLQCGTPDEVYLRPRCPFVANFLGDANLLPRGTGLLACGGITGQEACATGGWLVRPERVVLGERARACAHVWSGLVTGRAFLGADVLLEVAIEGTTLRVRCRATDAPYQAGEAVLVGVPAEAMWPIPEGAP
jgi:ABC-type Fe3+/spermidine/putrescine transport system ATPase subunit